MPFRIIEKIHAKNVVVVSKEMGVWKSLIHGGKLIAWGRSLPWVTGVGRNYAEDSYSVTSETFVVKDLFIFGFQKFSHEGYSWTLPPL